MKEMKYQSQFKSEVLDTGFCFGLLYYIMNLGTHPTAYIKIPKGHKLYGKTDEKIYQEVDVHGGITYINDSITPIYLVLRFLGWFLSGFVELMTDVTEPIADGINELFENMTEFWKKVMKGRNENE